MRNHPAAAAAAGDNDYDDKAGGRMEFRTDARRQLDQAASTGSRTSAERASARTPLHRTPPTHHTHTHTHTRLTALCPGLPG